MFARTGKTLASNTHLAKVQSQSFAMQDGTLRTSVTFEGWQLNITQFVSRSDPTLATMRIEAAPLAAGATAAGITIKPNITISGGTGVSNGVPGVAHNDTTPIPNWCTGDSPFPPAACDGDVC